MSSGIVIPSAGGQLMEWSAPIDYSSVVFNGAGLFPNIGDKYLDASARKNNGTLVNGPVWEYSPELGQWGMRSVKGAPAKHIDLTGTDTSTFAFIRNTMVFTISSWVKFDDPTNERNVIMGSSNTYSLKGFFYSLETVSYSGNVLLAAPRFWITYGSSTHGYDTYGSNNAITDTNWHHLLTCGRGLKNIEYWVDGVQLTSAVANDEGSNPGGADDYKSLLLNRNADAGGSDTINMSGVLASHMVLRQPVSLPQIQWLADPTNNPWQPWKRRLWSIAAVAVGTQIDLPLIQVVI